MNNYKKVLIPAIYLSAICVVVLCSFMVINIIKRYVNNTIEYNYTLDNVFSNDVMPVSKTSTDSIIRPYISDNVTVGKYYYDYESDSKKQEESLIHFENTYMQNNGVDYVSNETFDVVSILDGEVIGIEDNEIYGKILTIKHNDNLITTYSNVDGILINVGYKVSQGEIIATSKKDLLDKSKELLHFEVYYKGNSIDPENLYTLKVSDIE